MPGEDAWPESFFDLAAVVFPSVGVPLLAVIRIKKTGFRAGAGAFRRF